MDDTVNKSTAVQRSSDRSVNLIASKAGLEELHIAQRVHLGIWYILRAQRGSHILTFRPKYIPYSYMDPLGKAFWDLRDFRCEQGFGGFGCRVAALEFGVQGVWPRNWR